MARADLAAGDPPDGPGLPECVRCRRATAAALRLNWRRTRDALVGSGRGEPRLQCHLIENGHAMMADIGKREHALGTLDCRQGLPERCARVRCEMTQLLGDRTSTGSDCLMQLSSEVSMVQVHTASGQAGALRQSNRDVAGAHFREALRVLSAQRFGQRKCWALSKTAATSGVQVCALLMQAQALCPAATSDLAQGSRHACMLQMLCRKITDTIVVPSCGWCCMCEVVLLSLVSDAAFAGTTTPVCARMQWPAMRSKAMM